MPVSCSSHIRIDAAMEREAVGEFGIRSSTLLNADEPSASGLQRRGAPLSAKLMINELTPRLKRVEAHVPDEARDIVNPNCRGQVPCVSRIAHHPSLPPSLTHPVHLTQMLPGNA